MTDHISIKQNSSIGSQTTQIAVQNNFSGLSAENAVDLALKLFHDNFPTLREEAMAEARKRVDELLRETFQKLNNHGINNYNAFNDPDVQYSLNLAQVEYARLGTDHLKNTLSELLATRINYDNNYYSKIILDEALKSAKYLKESQLNYLSLIFFCKHLKLCNIDSAETLAARLREFLFKAPVPQNIRHSVSFLLMDNLLQLHIGTAAQLLSKTYNFSEETLKNSLPEELKLVPADYGLSPKGLAIAIVNFQSKTGIQLELSQWIKDN